VAKAQLQKSWDEWEGVGKAGTGAMTRQLGAAALAGVIFIALVIAGLF
jgi:hypothetical protein